MQRFSRIFATISIFMFFGPIAMFTQTGTFMFNNEINGNRMWATASMIRDGVAEKQDLYCSDGDGLVYGADAFIYCGGMADGSGWVKTATLIPDDPPVTHFDLMGNELTDLYEYKLKWVGKNEGWLLEVNPKYTGFVDVFIYTSPEGNNIYIPGWSYMVDGELQVPSKSTQGIYTYQFRPSMDDARWSDLVIVFVYGDIGIIDTTNYLPLVPTNWWNFEGKIIATGNNYRMKIVVDSPQIVCGFMTNAMLFFKDSNDGYWASGSDFNLRWMMVNFDRRNNWPQEFIWALGDKHYHREPYLFENLGNYSEFTRYLSLDDDNLPPYIIFPRQLELGKFSGPYQNYPSTGYDKEKDDRTDCDWVEKAITVDTWSTKWDLDYALTTVKTPAYTGKAIRIRFAEVSSQGDSFVEDWYFADGVGLVMIQTLSQGGSINVGSYPIHQQLKLKDFGIQIQ